MSGDSVVVKQAQAKPVAARWWLGAAAALALLATGTLAGCSSGSSTGTTLAANQSLHVALFSDVSSLDPANLLTSADTWLSKQVFDGLFELGPSGGLRPVIASGMPSVSSDGLTYTIEMRKDAHFSNGDPITSADVVYTWTRCVGQGDCKSSPLYQAIVGFDEASKGGQLQGLTAPDPYTVAIQLAHPYGSFALALGQPIVGLVDEKNVSAGGKDWWTTPAGLIGSGPFTMTARTPGVSMDFAPVPHWWGGSTGHLKAVHVEVIHHVAAQVKKYQSGGLDLVGGLTVGDPSVEDTRVFLNNPATKSQVHIYPLLSSAYVGFNFLHGPFAGAAGLNGRLALSRAIDRNQIAELVCESITCKPATGGLVPEGVPGYLGADADPNAKFDPAAAKALYEQWDPTGSKLNGLVINTYSTPIPKAIAENLQSQWKANLGINVGIDVTDLGTFATHAFNKDYALYVLSMLNDPDPGEFYSWFSCDNAAIGGINASGWCDPQYDQLVQQAEQLPVDQALPTYAQAGQIIFEQQPFFDTYYGTTTEFIKPYVVGAGRGTQAPYDWTGISILQH